ncbi:hypothetical protein C4F17_32080 [Variovorax sp. PMC12]|nr:hypothetical protein C4F17_32080 [Variovorax sp. PMC12]
MLRQRADLAPARGLICELHGCAFRDAQPDYVEAFQAGGFDEALFRLFLFALFDAAGHRVELGHRDLAFVLSKAGTTAAVDVLTVGTPVSGIEPQVDASRPPLAGRRSVGIGGCLFCELHGRQWHQPPAAGHPFVVAIQDFDHREMASGAPPDALLHFLFGGSDMSRDLNDLFPRGFFGEQEAENVSAILFCNDATIAKFNRLGQERHAGDVARMLRHGACLGDDHGDWTPAGYVYEVGRRGACKEAWNEGTVLIHNPHAAQPLPADWIGASAEIQLRDGRIVERLAQGFHPISSHTELLGQDTPAWWVEKRMSLLARECTAHCPGPAPAPSVALAPRNSG